MSDDSTSRLTRKGRATRARIVDVAARLMFHRGVAGTSIDEVRNTAAVSFWRRVVASYTRGTYQERIVNGEVRQVFDSAKPRPA